MVDPSLLGIQLPLPNTQVTPQPLPSPEVADSTRFQDLLSNVGQGQGGQLDSPSMRDQPVLQRINPTQTENTQGFTDAFVERVTGMDKSYHSIMDQLKNRPQLESYMDGLGNKADNLRTYPNVSSSGNNEATQLQDTIDKMRTDNKAMLNYERDVNTWSMNFQMWSSGVELASSIVSQLSRGFQTLFRASG